MAKKIPFKDSVMVNPLVWTRGTGETQRSGQQMDNTLLNT